jgi:hypothetical protein
MRCAARQACKWPVLENDQSWLNGCSGRKADIDVDTCGRQQSKPAVVSD